MRRIRLPIIFLALVILGDYGCAAQGAEESLRSLRSLIEEQIKDEFDKAISGIANDPNLKTKNAQEAEAAKEVFKLLFYNKAYNVYACTKSMAHSSATPAEWSAKSERCWREHNEEAAKMIKIATGYDALFSNKEAMKCELKARLFDAEFEFPPFDFLKTSKGRDYLFDFKLLNACLVSIVQ